MTTRKRLVREVAGLVLTMVLMFVASIILREVFGVGWRVANVLGAAIGAGLGVPLWFRLLAQR